MMPQAVFGLLLGSAMLYGCAAGTGGETFAAALKGAEEAVETALVLAGTYGFFCGLMSLLQKAGAAEALARLFSPALGRLFGKGLPPQALEPVAMNLTANLLGMGSAATPMGLRAAERMGGERASDALCLFLVLNASSVQVLPATVIGLRAAAGSADPARVALPALGATVISTAVGVLSCKLMEKWT